MSKKILGLDSLYKQAIGNESTMNIACPLLVEMIEYIGEMESAIIDFKAVLRSCKNSSTGVLDQHKCL
ncbi:MAG: hypothetical protein ACJAS1_001634 [Oleiphilaceae bacterium]|jgi:hypothetical protein